MILIRAESHAGFRQIPELTVMTAYIVMTFKVRYLLKISLSFPSGYPGDSRMPWIIGGMCIRQININLLRLRYGTWSSKSRILQTLKLSA